jgi:antitoxin (DNA-binding transcriptional repressor) of toxin-antitoxin stability system
MKTVEVTKATLPLAEYTKDVIKEPVIVTIKGKPVAALVNIRNADIETVALSQNQKFLNLIERSRCRQGKEGGISTEEMRQRLKQKRAEPSKRKR